MCDQCHSYSLYSSYAYAYSILNVNSTDLKKLLYESTSQRKKTDYECRTCKEKTVATNTGSFDCESKILIIHIPKTKNQVEYVEELILNKSRITNMGKEVYIMYRLFGIVNYIGDGEGGHYYAFVKYGDKWWEVNDSYIKEVGTLSKKYVMPFMLFYEKGEIIV